MMVINTKRTPRSLKFRWFAARIYLDPDPAAPNTPPEEAEEYLPSLCRSLSTGQVGVVTLHAALARYALSEVDYVAPEEND